MKSFFTGLILVVVSQASIFAQKSPSKFGDILLSDLKKTNYDLDSSASAVYLFDFGKSYITSNATDLVLNFERHFRIKVLSKNGLDLANIEIPLYRETSGEEKVTQLKAVTYNLENGVMVESKMSKDAVFKEKFTKNIFIHKFTLPNVREGSIIEVAYTVTSEFIFNFPNWQFQYNVPVRYSEYWALIPEYFTFQKYQQGYVSPTTYEEKRQNSPEGFVVNGHHWICERVPAFKKEPKMTSGDDYISKVNFALSQVSVPGQLVRNYMHSWESHSYTLADHEDFGKVVTGSNFLKKTVEEITAGMTEPMQKTNAIYDYIKKNITWDGTEDKYPDNLKTILEKKKGTSADINFLFASMLEKANIPVEMVLLSTRKHGFIRHAYPMKSQLNYVICSVTVGDKTLLVDASDPYLPINILPERCLNGEGLVVSRTDPRWTEIQSKGKHRKTVEGEFKLSAAGELKGKLAYGYDGYEGQQMRTRYASAGEKDILKDFVSDKTWELEKTEFQNIQEIDKALKQTHEVTISDHATIAGDIIYVNPFVSNQIKENVFKEEARIYPVDYGSAHEETYMVKFIMPEGYTVDEIPKSKMLALPGNGGKYIYNASVAGNVISVVSIFQINKNIFIQNEYAALREFYNQIVAKQAEQIVIKKKL